MKNKRLLLPVSIDYSSTTSFSLDDDRFIPVELYIMHNGVNVNGTRFNIDAIKEAEWSLKEVPIRGYIKETEDGYDFDEHNVDVYIDDNDIVRFEELCETYGNIPSNNNIRYMEVDDRNYVVVDGYLWKKYLNRAQDILDRNKIKSISMEIYVEDGFYDDIEEVFEITKYKYLGIVILGEDVEPGMVGAHMTVLSDNVMNEYSKREENRMNVEEKNLNEQTVDTEVDSNKPDKQLEETSVEETTVENVEETTQEEVSAEQPAEEQPVEEEQVEETVEVTEEEATNEVEEEKQSLEDKLNELIEANEKLKEENSGFKRKEQERIEQERLDGIAELFEQYSNVGVDLSAIKENVGNKSVEEIKNEIALEVLDTKFSKSSDDINIEDNDFIARVKNVSNSTNTSRYGSFNRKLENNKE